ncbi:TatD family hydrolase [Paeniglutamicibacter gangotriensis]|uniref:Metal-dependent DNase n=1 Tax=Paeniglutamicibacter gangotriensis Lz1y TaxID=1276920 RepID=M7MWE9_9MICC|nr:TatD family hydrolase [Paeniglutamicibacter gangotriensis]EMQ99396.1 metal-dependent DNase [Paeniglutamicibacter gangotriensis Lz1y]
MFLQSNDTVIGVLRVTSTTRECSEPRTLGGPPGNAPRGEQTTKKGNAAPMSSSNQHLDTGQTFGVPQAYLPAEAAAEAGPLSRSTKDDAGKKRNTSYPPAPEPLPYGVPDNHTHLDFRDGSVHVTVAAALDAANAVGVPGVIQVGCDVESSEFAVRAASEDPRVLAAVSIHPNDAPRLAESDDLDAAIARIDELAAHERVRAIGETGLDYFRTQEPGRPAQEYSFREHIRIARKHSKALQIHDRDAHLDVVRVLKDEQLPERVVFHCFSGDADLARICNENGWYLSFSGTVTFKNSTDLREALLVAKPELVLVETDAPFLTPHPYRGRPNASYLIPQTVRFMAETLGVGLEEYCRTLADNTERVYGAF